MIAAHLSENSIIILNSLLPNGQATILIRMTRIKRNFMKRNIFTVCVTVVATLFGYSVNTYGAGDSAAVNVERTKKVVFILVDGIPKDVIEKLDTPNLDSISRMGGLYSAYVGGLKNGYSQTPTISAVGYNSMLTGTWVNKHNVSTNDIKAPNYNYWTLFRMAEEYDQSLKTAIFTSWTDNRTKLIGHELKATGFQELDYIYDGLDLDEEKYPKEKKDYHIFKIDEAVSIKAGQYIAENAPDLSWVYLWYPDDAAHMFGDSEYFYDHVKKADQQIGRVWRAVEKRMQEFNEDWMIIVTTDHGRTAVNGKGHGGHSMRERATWIATNVKANDYSQHNPGITAIAPSVVKFMEIEIPEYVENEIDGVSFFGDISIAKPVLEKKDNLFTVSWKAFGDGNVQIFVSATNEFKVGGKDQYQLIGDARLREELFSFPVPKEKSDRYKVLLKSKHNSVNVWWEEGD